MTPETSEKGKKNPLIERRNRARGEFCREIGEHHRSFILTVAKGTRRRVIKQLAKGIGAYDRGCSPKSSQNRRKE